MKQLNATPVLDVLLAEVAMLRLEIAAMDKDMTRLMDALDKAEKEVSATRPTD